MPSANLKERLIEDMVTLPEKKAEKKFIINLASKYMNSVIPRLDRGIQSFQ
jgi:hypothetical protein